MSLGAAGYVNIGLDHFARPDDELVRAQQNKTLWRNFQGYTTHKDCDILAFGASSISQTADVYMQNEKNLKRYQERVAATGFAVERGLKLTRDDQIQREAITRVMCDLELDFAAFGGEWGIAFTDYFADALTDLRPLADDGLVKIEAGKISVTPTGTTVPAQHRHVLRPLSEGIRQRQAALLPYRLIDSSQRAVWLK